MPGTSFDRVAAIYDETRGGQRRGDLFAATLAPWIVGDRVIELGIGTGVIAKGLADHGHGVVGFDLSAPMMDAARDRIGSRVAVADVDRLPIADGSIDTAFFVWVLHLVDDAADSLREAARVVHPGGRVITILANADDHPDDEIAAVLSGLAPVRRIGRGLDPSNDAAPADLSLIHSGFTAWDRYPEVPNELADLLERRGISSLFDVDDETWTSVVAPVIEGVRALPEPDQAHTRINRHPLIVWDRR